MKKNIAFVLLTLMISTGAFASNCHEIVGKKVLGLGKDALMNQEISSKDLNWLRDMVEVAVSRADGNNFSCSINDGGVERPSVSVIILNQGDIPVKVKKLIIKNDKLLSKLISGLN